MSLIWPEREKKKKRKREEAGRTTGSLDTGASEQYQGDRFSRSCVNKKGARVSRTVSTG